MNRLTPGTTISKDSWEAATDYLPSEILDKIKAGELAFTIQETTDLPVSEEYISNKAIATQTKLGAYGELKAMWQVCLFRYLIRLTLLLG